ncbi:uncharacterized protein [Nicotiana tomentosiformis]|uniref:uncharacterized protein n=1 Tax=Nicotiana tomentosiformis TaxID=4098 RepID=UPI00388CB0CD
MVTAPATTPPTQPDRGGGWTGRGRPRGGSQARYYSLPARTEAVASDSVITGIVLVCRRDATVLFDPGSTYSYVTSYFAPYLGVSRDSLSSPAYVPTSVGDSIVVDRVYWSYLVVLSGFEIRANLLLLNMVDFDVILGMDQLSPYHVILDCHAKMAQRMVEKECDAYLAYVRDFSTDSPTVESVPIVRDYRDVFLTQVLPTRSGISELARAWRLQETFSISL